MKLLRLGDVAGTRRPRHANGARQAAELSRRLKAESAHDHDVLLHIEDELRQARDELVCNHEWIESLRTSARWRMTAPLRAAKLMVKRLSRRVPALH